MEGAVILLTYQKQNGADKPVHMENFYDSGDALHRATQLLNKGITPIFFEDEDLTYEYVIRRNKSGKAVIKPHRPMVKKSNA